MQAHITIFVRPSRRCFHINDGKNVLAAAFCSAQKCGSSCQNSNLVATLRHLIFVSIFLDFFCMASKHERNWATQKLWHSFRWDLRSGWSRFFSAHAHADWTRYWALCEMNVADILDQQSNILGNVTKTTEEFCCTNEFMEKLSRTYFLFNRFLCKLRWNNLCYCNIFYTHMSICKLPGQGVNSKHFQWGLQKKDLLVYYVLLLVRDTV